MRVRVERVEDGREDHASLEREEHRPKKLGKHKMEKLRVRITDTENTKY